MASHASVPSSLLSNVFESLVAAIHLDGGSEPARSFIERYVGPEIDLAASGGAESNYKSMLQQLVQRQYGTTPTYQLVAERGPDHSKYFKIAADVCGTHYPPAWGRNKKEAEQRAARNALSALDEEPIPHPAEDE